MSEQAVKVLKQAVDGHKAQVMTIGADLERKQSEVVQLKNSFNYHSTQITELEAAIAKLENQNVEVTSKNKKAKR